MVAMNLRRMALTGAALLALVHPVDADTRAMGASASLRGAIAEPGIRGHLEALQAVADRNGGNRAAGTAGLIPRSGGGV